MGWDKRGYYYRSQRCGTSVKRVYLGAGAEAHRAAAQDAAARAQKAAETAELACLQARVEAVEQLDAAAHHSLSLLLEATLLAEGWHLHRGQWRRRRGRCPTD